MYLSIIKPHASMKASGTRLAKASQLWLIASAIAAIASAAPMINCDADEASCLNVGWRHDRGTRHVVLSATAGKRPIEGRGSQTCFAAAQLHQRRSRGPSAAPAIVHNAIVPPYHKATNGRESSVQWSA